MVTKTAVITCTVIAVIAVTLLTCVCLCCLATGLLAYAADRDAFSSLLTPTPIAQLILVTPTLYPTQTPYPLQPTYTFPPKPTQPEAPAAATQPAPTQAPPTQAPPTEAPTQPAESAIGQVATFDDHTISLTDAVIQGEKIIASFHIINTSSKPIAVSSLLNFTTRTLDGRTLEQDIFDCTTSSLDGTILAGEQLRGDICWANPTAGPVKIYYQPNLFGGKIITWTLTP